MSARFFLILVLICLYSFILARPAQASGDANEGRLRYLANCAGCHGVPPDHRASSAAGDLDYLFLTINNVGRMGFLATRLSFADLVNITTYLADTALNQNVTGVAPLGNGAGLISSNPAGLSCGTRCAWNFAPNSEVVLRATPLLGSRFVGWSGACTGTTDCRLITDTAKAAYATFERNGPVIDYADIWWGGGSENGWGLSVSHSAVTGQLINVLFIYDRNGDPTWFITEGGAWSDNFSVYRAPLLQPVGPPQDQYQVSQYQPGTARGELVLRFASANALEMQFTIDGISGVRTLTRQPKDSQVTPQPFNIAELGAIPSSTSCRLCRDNRAAAPLRVDGLWWGGTAQNGWGLSFAQRRVTLFGLWYTFARDGSPTWFVMPTGVWLDREYRATLYRTNSAAWLNASYNPAQLVTTSVGAISLVFDNTGGMAMSYRFDAGSYSGVMQSRTMTRRPF